MQTITFTCETITPMFLAGADGQTPELRAPSIKGALRFWWRAMNGHSFSSVEEMKTAEGKIFGDTGGRSKVILHNPIIITERDVEISGTPHHKKNNCPVSGCVPPPNKNFCPKGIKRLAKMYTFSLKVLFNDNIISQEALILLFRVAFLLGGFGKRSRRGFGSCSITLDEEANLSLSTVATILGNFSSNINKNFPIIKNTQIYNSPYSSYEEILSAIGRASHNHKHKSLGYVGRDGRLSSPVYVSVFKDNNKYYPIVTRLYSQADTMNQRNFINEITT